MSARLRSLAKLGLLLAGLVAGGLLLRAFGAAPGTDWVDEHVRGQGLLGEAVFLALGTATTAVGVPRQAIAFLGGYAFGAPIGIGLSLLAQLLGCAVSFFWAAAIGRGWAERRLAGRFGTRLRPLVETLRQSTFGATLALRLLPVGNNLALNMLAGMSGVGAGAFLAGSAAGYLPQTVVFALIGEGIAVDRRWQLVLGAALLVLASAIGLWLLRRHRAGRVVDQD
jgi:uncharacterized membrane protein YdjX (TVP38/TMEM64 family)